MTDKEFIIREAKIYADELFNKFKYGPGIPHLWEITDKKISKQFTLVCIDEIYKKTHDFYHFNIDISVRERLDYLKEVKRQIKKL